jgi:hypothetical protein
VPEASPDDPHEAMRAAQDRRFEREGIPMVLALFDERGTGARLPDASEDEVLREGAAYSDIVARYRDQLFPQARDTDLWPAIVVLQALSYAHLHAVPTPGAGR